MSEESTATAETTAPAALLDAETSQPAVQPDAAETATVQGDKDQTTTEGEKEAGDTKASPYPITVPEGMVVNESLMEAVTPIFQEMGLEPEQVQTLADAYSQVELARAKADEQAHLEQMTTWQDEVKADPEIGGAKFDEHLGMANQALKQFGSPELIQLLDETGMGNNKEVIRAFMKVGKELSEGSMVPGGEAGSAKPTLDQVARQMFPTMTK